MANLEALTAMNAQNITQSDSTIYDPPLKFLHVFEVGVNVNIVNEKGDEVLYTIPANSDAQAPILIPGRIRQVLSTDTTAANASLIGYK